MGKIFFPPLMQARKPKLSADVFGKKLFFLPNSQNLIPFPLCARGVKSAIGVKVAYLKCNLLDAGSNI